MSIVKEVLVPLGRKGGGGRIGSHFVSLGCNINSERHFRGRQGHNLKAVLNYLGGLECGC